MKCKNCGKDIEDSEMFCSDCKKELKKVSSRSEVEELEDLIGEQTKLNELEQTKELTDLNDLVEVQLDEKVDVDKTIRVDIDNKHVEETREERMTSKDNNPIEKKNKKKLIIIILCILFVVIISITVILMFTMRNKNEVKDEVIDYKEVINKYGKSIEKTVEEYLDENEEIPTWTQVTELNKYKKYEVVCDIHTIYKDGSVYLNECKVNDKKVKYSYGNLKEEDGKKLDIYKIDYNKEYYTYSDKSEIGSSLIGTVTCKTDSCEYIEAYDKYVIVSEDNKYYLYDYENDTIEFGPFNLSSDRIKNLIFDDHTLYGIYYSEEGINNIYSISANKTFKNIKGILLQDGFYNISSVLYKYNYVVLVDKENNNFINLNTGNISYSIKGTLGEFIEDKSNKLVYITSYTNDSKTNFKIYNSNGKALFGGKEFKYFKVTNDNILVGNDTEFKIYDKKLNLKTSSKKYDSVLGIYEDFIVVIENKYLKVVDLDDKEIVAFGFEWDYSRYSFYNKLSGWNTENGKYGIYLMIEDKTIPYGTLGNGLEYYYIPDIKEAGVIETPGFR